MLVPTDKIHVDTFDSTFPSYCEQLQIVIFKSKWLVIAKILEAIDRCNTSNRRKLEQEYVSI